MKRIEKSEEYSLLKPYVREHGYGLAAAILTLTLLNHGWAAFDDGFYAWVAERLLEGARLHTDVVTSHPGYAHYLHACLFSVFGEQLSTLRFPLPLLAWILVSAIARLARSAGTLAQGISAFSAATLGIVQWNTPSAGWFSVALTAAAIVTFCNAHVTTAHRRNWLLLTGVLLGLCAGFRQHNGILLAAGLVLLQLLLTNPPRKKIPAKWQQATSFLSLLTALFLLVFPAISALTASTLLLLFPAILCVIFALKKWLANPELRHVDWMPPVATGCMAGFLPIIVIALAQGALPAFISNTVIHAQGYSTYSGILDNNFTLVLSDALELLSMKHPYPWANAFYMLLITTLPLLLAMLIYLRRDVIREPFVIGLVVLSSICLPIGLTLQNLLYSYYWLPAVSAAIITLFALKPTRVTIFYIALAIAAPSFALIFHAGRIPGSNWGDLMSKPLEPQSLCTLPKCDLQASQSQLSEISENHRDIITNVPANLPLLILPEGVSLYPLLPHPSPWRLGFALDGLTPDREIDKLANQIKNTQGTVILVSHTYFHKLEKNTKLNKMINSWCFYGETPRYKRYARCPPTNEELRFLPEKSGPTSG